MENEEAIFNEYLTLAKECITNKGQSAEEAVLDYLLFNVFNFCGCGITGNSTDFIMKGLQHIKKTHTFHENNPKHTKEEWTIFWKQHKCEGHKLFKNESIEYFFYYWADSIELTEHGGSVPGWLTPLGEDVLVCLQRIWRVLDFN